MPAKVRTGPHFVSAERVLVLSWLRDQNTDIDADGAVVIGPHGTRVPVATLRREPFVNYLKTLRCIVRAVYGREYLARHTLTGNKSPRKVDHEQKQRLDARIDDVIHFMRRFTSAHLCQIRAGITIMCNDEAKWFKHNR